MSIGKFSLALFICSAAVSLSSSAAPAVSRLTPPSELFTSGQSDPVIARFLPGQRFDLQATIQPDDASKSITEASFAIDGKPVTVKTSLRVCSAGCVKDTCRESRKHRWRWTIFRSQGWSRRRPSIR